MCGAPRRRDTGESLVAGRRHWQVEVSCAGCGHSWIGCGSGEPPPEVRQAVLAEHGPVTVSLAVSPQGSGARLLRCLREIRGGTLSEARAAADALRGSGLEGTLVEGELLAGALRAAGFDVVVTAGS